MRTMFLAVATAAATVAFSALAMAQAPIYPWCAQYEEGTNCGFTSLAQCQQALSGNGGFCDQNPNILVAPLTTSSIPPGPSARTTTGSAPRTETRPRVAR